MFAFEKIELSKEDMEKSIKDEKIWGKDWATKNLFHKRVKAYVDSNLFLIREKSKWGTPYNCYHTGHEVYRRADNNPITQDDLDALDNYWSGQGNKVIGKVGDMEVVRDWFCDSGD